MSLIEEFTATERLLLKAAAAIELADLDSDAGHDHINSPDLIAELRQHVIDIRYERLAEKIG